MTKINTVKTQFSLINKLASDSKVLKAILKKLTKLVKDATAAQEEGHTSFSGGSCTCNELWEEKRRRSNKDQKEEMMGKENEVKEDDWQHKPVCTKSPQSKLRPLFQELTNKNFKPSVIL